MNEKRYRGAVKELIDQGYLIQKESGSNRYTFFELPNQNVDVQNHAPTTPDNAVLPPASGRASAQNGSADMSPMGREIIQNITTNNTTTNTNNNTIYSTNNNVHYVDDDEYYKIMGESVSDSWDDDILPF